VLSVPNAIAEDETNPLHTEAGLRWRTCQMRHWRACLIQH
jgi:hypothetical protein